MMKVSDPIIFGHAVRAYFAELFAEHGDALAAPASTPTTASARCCAALERCPTTSARDPRGDRRRLRRRPGAGDGRLRPRDHEPARAQRRDHRRLDAGGDPRLGADVERRRRAAGHEVRDPRPLLRGAVRRDRRGLPRARRVRPGDDGHDAERRPDGAGGRGVRLARQDVRDRRRRARSAWSTTAATTLLEHDGRGGRHLAHVPDQGRRRSATGSGSPSPRARATGAPGGVLARRDARRTTRSCCARSAPALARARHRRPADRDHGRRRGDALHARARARAARTRSRSPATCCATT